MYARETFVHSSETDGLYQVHLTYRPNHRYLRTANPPTIHFPPDDLDPLGCWILILHPELELHSRMSEKISDYNYVYFFCDSRSHRPLRHPVRSLLLSE